MTADVNAFALISLEIEEQYREFSLATASMADSFGITAAAIVSIFLERFLKQHRRR